MESEHLEFGEYSFHLGHVSFKGLFLPPLVLPLPDLTPGSPVMACSLLAGRLVRTFTHGIALLPWVGYGLSWPVCVCKGGTVVYGRRCNPSNSLSVYQDKNL